MSDRDTASASSQAVMRDTGFPPPDPGAVVHTAQRYDLTQATRDIEQRVALVDRIHGIIQKQINKDSDIKNIGGKFRRTVNFARKCFRIVGGNIEWQTYPSGLKYLRESMQDEQGAWFAVSVACVYVTPWGERIEAFKRITSRDPFLGEKEDDDGCWDVNEQNIVEKAVTESFKSAIFTALGFPKDITPDELKRFGVSSEGVQGHSFEGAKGAQGGSQDSSQESYDARKKIEVICRRLAESGFTHKGAECPTAAEVLRATTANPDKGWNGWGSFRAIKEAQLAKILANLERLEAEHTGGGEPREPGQDG